MIFSAWVLLELPCLERTVEFVNSCKVFLIFFGIMLIVAAALSSNYLLYKYSFKLNLKLKLASVISAVLV